MTDGADPRAQQRVGSVLSEKWTLEHLIGSGGMGAVYAARHRNGARAAVKILHPELARISEVRERFLREGYAANRVEHRGVVQVLDDDIVKDGPDEGSAYLVMELLEGESLQDRVGRAPKLGERELLEVMDAVLDVLGAAHQHGVVHRDLKPENIFLAKDPERDGVRVKVLDFGLARISEASTVTSAGIAVGTPSFMSPEQAAGRSDEIDGRTDIFALGATIFRIVTGRRIHDADNMVQLVVLMATVPAPRLRSVAPDVSEGLARVIDRALAFDRNDRYPDAAAMQAEVRAAIELAGRGPAATLQVIPFSARNVRVGSLSEVAAPDPPESPRAKANTGTDLTSVEKEAGFFSSDDEADEEESAASHTTPAKAIAQSATLPWALVLILLGLGAWKLGPSLQDELERRASLAPIQNLWAAPSASASGEGAPAEPSPPVVTAAHAPPPPPVEAIPAAAPAPVALEMDEDAGALTVVEVAPDAGEAIAPAAAPTGTPAPAPAPAPSPEPLVQRDAGVPHAPVAAVPRPRPPAPAPPQTTKPPVKKPPAKKPPPPPPQRRR